MGNQLSFKDSVLSAVNDIYWGMRRGLKTTDIPNWNFWRNRVEVVLAFIKPVTAARRVNQDELGELLKEFEAVADLAKMGLFLSVQELPSPLDKHDFPILHGYILKRCNLLGVLTHTFTWEIAPGETRSETVLAREGAPSPEPEIGERHRAAQEFVSSLKSLRAACNTPQKRHWLAGFREFIEPNKRHWHSQDLQRVSESIRAITERVQNAEDGDAFPSINGVFAGVHLPGAHSNAREAHSLGSSPPFHLLSRRQRVIYSRTFPSFSAY